MSALERTLSCAALLLAAPAVAQMEYPPFGRDPSDPESSFAMRDKAGNEQLHLVRPAPSPGRIEGERCMPKTQLCFSLNEVSATGQPLLRVRVFGPASDGDRFFPLDVGSDLKGEANLWTLAVRRTPYQEGDAAGEPMIVGVTVSERIGYSGGAAARTRLWLFRIDNAGTDQATAHEVLSVPLEASQSIRACFNEKDEKARHGACLDETSVQTMLIIDPANTDPMPKFDYRVQTGSYPSDIPFRQPEELPKRLTKKDLVHATNSKCSYSRKVLWNPATDRYEFDRPAPECRVFGLEK